jgi:hypothetical protein
MPQPRVFRSERLRYLARCLAEECEKPDEYSSLYVDSLTLAACIDFLRLARDDLAVRAARLAPRQLRRVQEYLIEHLAETVRLNARGTSNVTLQVAATTCPRTVGSSQPCALTVPTTDRPYKLTPFLCRLAAAKPRLASSRGGRSSFFPNNINSFEWGGGLNAHRHSRCTCLSRTPKKGAINIMATKKVKNKRVRKDELDIEELEEVAGGAAPAPSRQSTGGSSMSFGQAGQALGAPSRPLPPGGPSPGGGARPLGLPGEGALGNTRNTGMMPKNNKSVGVRVMHSLGLHANPIKNGFFRKK